MSDYSVLNWMSRVVAVPVYIIGLGLFVLGYWVLRLAEHIEGADEFVIKRPE